MKKITFGWVRKTLKGKGFALALLLSVGAVGIATYVAYDQAISKIITPTAFPTVTERVAETAANEPDSPEDYSPVQNDQTGIPKQTQTPEIVNRPAETAAPAATEAAVTVAAEKEADPAALNPDADEANSFFSKPAKTLPVSGEITVPFSNGELVKSQTLGVWKTHDGADIAAAAGTPVVAVTDGTVTDVYTDALWGVCVMIDHGEGLTSYYFNLDVNVPVVKDQQVKSGDAIGAVGQTAEIEIAEPSHLHFAVKQDGVWIDPIQFVNG
jgi:murein DD-endopeptidase MepM/ murein hydrolase activator NlpD